MTASTGTVREGLGNHQLGLALAGVALVAAILTGGFAIGQLTKVQLAPLAPARPTFDHGSADLSTSAAAAASALNRGAAWDPALSSGAGVWERTRAIPLIVPDRGLERNSMLFPPQYGHDHAPASGQMSDSSLHHPRD